MTVAYNFSFIKLGKIVQMFELSISFPILLTFDTALQHLCKIPFRISISPPLSHNSYMLHSICNLKDRLVKLLLL